MSPVTGKVREKEHMESSSSIEVKAEKTAQLNMDRSTLEGAAQEADAQKAPIKTSGKRGRLNLARDIIRENMPPVYAPGRELPSLAEERAAEAPRDSEELKAIRIKLKQAEDFLNAPMPPLPKRPEDEEKYRDSLKKACADARLIYSELMESLEQWLKEKDSLPDYSEERYELIKRMKDQAADESEGFESALFDYREMMTGSPETLEGIELTWADMLRHERAELIDLDAKKIKTSTEGAGTSDIIKFDWKGKTCYFKAEENMATGSFSEVAHKTAMEQGLDKNLFEGFARAVNDTIQTFDGAKMWENMRDVFNYIRAGATHLLDKNANPISRYIRGLSKGQEPLFEKIFKETYKRQNCKAIAQESALIKEGRNLSRRNVATSRMAQLLGIDDIIAPSHTVVIKKNGKRIRGNVMEQAKGSEERSLKQTRCTYSDEAEDELICLQFFDLICGQIDRHYGNFLLDTESSSSGENVISGICAIDNDMSFGNMDFKTAAKGTNRLRRLRRDMIKLIPEKFKRAVLELDPSFTGLILRDLIEQDEINSLNDRIRGLQDYIRRVDAQDEAEIQKKLERGESEAELRDRELAKLNFLIEAGKEPVKKVRDQYRVQNAAGLEKATLFSGYFTAEEQEYLDRIEKRRAELRRSPASQAQGA
ncbi:MAG: hypothetical protein J6O71_04810 [Lachnospiraceae bacterium]|nr:hypothetical protein [Lachnospiraceae bacterium]